uniref:pilus assembly FimT family protein n=1 Tax=Pseudomonas aeruginosa TaxID=287 RepID=UPI00300CC2E1
MRSICRSAGFSLIELMMVLVLVAIFASIAVPSFNALIERNRIQTASEELYSLLQYARSEAVNRHANVSIRATQNNDDLPPDFSTTSNLVESVFRAGDGSEKA